MKVSGHFGLQLTELERNKSILIMRNPTESILNENNFTKLLILKDVTFCWVHPQCTSDYKAEI